MTTQEKFRELSKLATVNVRLDSANTWRVVVEADVIYGKRKKKRFSRGNTWDEAIDEMWRIYSEPGAIIRSSGKQYTWIGCGWQETLQEPVILRD